MVSTKALLKVTLTRKQAEASKYLSDRQTAQVLFGGGAGGAKSFLGCWWLVKCCLRYDGTRYLMGRSVLKRLKETTLNTFFDVAKKAGLSADEHFHYSEMRGEIEFFNGSKILLKDLYQYPSDPEFDSLGSLEITGAFIDECNQITVKARDIVFSRIRYRLDEYGLTPKMLMTCNPAKNWVYTEFYKPWSRNQLQKDRAFVQALVRDNPFISTHYVNSLQKLDTSSRERLLAGNWEYTDDPTVLMEFDAIASLFHNDHVQPDPQARYISADVALQGSDRFVVGVWHGWVLVELVIIAKSSGKEVLDKINALRVKHQVPPQNVVFDADGVGSFLGGEKGFLPGSRAFKNNGQPFLENFKKPNYENLKTQAYYHLAKRVNDAGMYLSCVKDTALRQEFIEELEQVKSRDRDKDTTLKLVKKEDVKQFIGRSPDLADMLMLRMYFDLIPKSQPRRVAGA